MTETQVFSLSNTELTNISPRYQGGLTIYYVEENQSFHVFKKGKQISCIIPADTTTIGTFRRGLELLNRDEDYK